METKSKICIGIPCNRQVKSQTVLSLLQMVAIGGYEYFFVIASEGYTISENRTYIIKKAQEVKCTHILFVDDDMIFPADTLYRLLAHKKEIVGVNSHSRKLPLQSTVLFTESEMPKELFEAIQVGGGVLLIDLKVFDTITKPWFATKTDPNGMTTMGEDAYFCEQAYLAKYKVWCDPTVEIGHVGDYIY